MQTPLDQALVAAQQKADAKGAFFEMILNTRFFVPTDGTENGASQTQQVQAGDAVKPLVLQHDNNPYLLLFDTRDRMMAWAGREIAHVQLPGYILAEMTKGDLYWAINVGTDHPHELRPTEVDWLHQAVRQQIQDTDVGTDPSPEPT